MQWLEDPARFGIRVDGCLDRADPRQQAMQRRYFDLLLSLGLIVSKRCTVL